jgi:acyl carrier protein
MSQTETAATVDRIVADVLRVSEDELDDDSTFGEDVEAESLDYVEIAETIAFELDVEIPDEDLQEFETVGDVKSYVEARR